MNNEEARSLMRDIRENAEKIRKCSQHVFGDVLGGPDNEGSVYNYNARRTCMECGGTMKETEIVNYARGYKAAGGDPDDIAMFYDGSSIE